MIVLQTVAVAFAMFSAVPVPQFNWIEKNMRYAMCAFPLIGVVIGLLWFLCGVLPLPGAARAAGFCLIPVWVTGGIHLDGYADTCDALTAKTLLDRKNLLILKAFTKLYGMAGVRLGYCLCANTALLEAMQAAGQPWAVSSLAQAAGLAALDETAHGRAASTGPAGTGRTRKLPAVPGAGNAGRCPAAAGRGAAQLQQLPRAGRQLVPHRRAYRAGKR